MNKEAGAEPSGELKPDTLLTTGGRDPLAQHGYVNTPVYHASTLLYPTAEDYVAHRGKYHYGRRGTPTSEALETAIRTLDGPACAAVASLVIGRGCRLYLVRRTFTDGNASVCNLRQPARFLSNI